MNGLNYLKTHSNVTRPYLLLMIAQQKMKRIKNEMVYQSLHLAVDIEISLYEYLHRSIIVYLKTFTSRLNGFAYSLQKTKIVLRTV